MGALFLGLPRLDGGIVCDGEREGGWGEIESEKKKECERVGLMRQGSIAYVHSLSVLTAPQEE